MKNLLLLCASGSLLVAATTQAADLRIGIIGCDTSHATAFTKLFNDATDKNHVAGGKVVAAYKGGSPDIPESAGRIDGIVKQLQEKYGVKMVGFGGGPLQGCGCGVAWRAWTGGRIWNRSVR